MMQEPYLGSPAGTIAVLDRYHFNIQKKYGQNFLIDSHVLMKIVEYAGIGRDDSVIEIGPGIGTLTQYLALAAHEVTAVEIDRELIPILEDTLGSYDNITILNQDILKTDIRSLVNERGAGRAVKIVANLPYYITTPIIMGLLENHVPVESITVMVQKEVASRMQEGPGSKEYGALSLAVQYYARPEIVANVPPNCFIPRPKVGSSVIKLVLFKEPPVSVKNEAMMFRIIRAAFGQRRKTLVNALGNCAELPVTKEEAAVALETLGLRPDIRGEALDLGEFAQLSNVLC